MSSATADRRELGPAAPDPFRVVKQRHPWRWVSVAIALLLAGRLVVSMITNDAYRWDVFAQYMFSEAILSGLLLTLEVTAMAMALGIVLGIVIAVCRMSRNPILSNFAWFYTWIFRGTPTLVQLIFFYNLSALYPKVTLGIPFGPDLHSWPTNALISAMVAGVLGLGLNEAAYMSEIVRGGLLSIDRGQTEAAMGLGMTPWQTFRRIVLPQAVRVIIPPTFNNIIGMLKYSSLVSVLSLGDLLYVSEQIFSRNFQPIPLLLAASTWYLACTSILMVGQIYIERIFGKGVARAGSTRIGRVLSGGRMVRKVVRG
ncbi:amino acid ABC transporter permease [Dactylosporangium sp. CA-233914]|uniref:amino acid ABC transporter permease n=1 Tax=Dactylosporangium sp. CA-233914 TaxID=3239934 RepID=UPI003D8E1014